MEKVYRATFLFIPQWIVFVAANAVFFYYVYETWSIGRIPEYAFVVGVFNFLLFAVPFVNPLDRFTFDGVTLRRTTALLPDVDAFPIENIMRIERVGRGPRFPTYYSLYDRNNVLVLRIKDSHGTRALLKELRTKVYT